ncbi:hypothetical protein V8E36_003222 [Tilletia maclaganii]
MLPSTSRTTFAPSGELLIDGLGVDGRDLSKGEAGWAEPYSPTLAAPTTRRFSTRPSIGPVELSSALPSSLGAAYSESSAAVLPSHEEVASPSSSSAAAVAPPLPISLDLSRNPSAIPFGLADSPADFGACTAAGCPGDAEGAGSMSSVTIFDIIERRTCRPISLHDLRTYLLARRASSRKASKEAIAQKAQLPDLSLLVGVPRFPEDSSFSEWNHDPEKTLTESAAEQSQRSRRSDRQHPAKGQHRSSSSARPESRSRKSSAGNKNATSRNRHRRSSKNEGDDVDALDFVAVFNRYNRRFNALSRPQRLRSPDPATFVQSPLGGGNAPATTCWRTASRATGAGVGASPGGLEGAVTVEVVLRTSGGASGNPSQMQKEVAIFPAAQPMREEFDNIVSRFLGRRRCAAASELSKKDETDEVVKNMKREREPSSSSLASSLSSRRTPPRLRWMVDIGLISETQIELALAEAELSTHPQVLAPLADKVATYLNEHIVPNFLDGATSNLSRGTQLGRLVVGLACTALAILFTVLLAVKPSPLDNSRSREGPGGLPRWWRLLTAPLWVAGVGYVLAAWTGVCVWLTLRGNHEPGDEEAEEAMTLAEAEALGVEDAVAAGERDAARHSIGGAGMETGPRSSLHVGDPALPWRREDQKSLLAPELVNLLRAFLFLKPLPVSGLASLGGSERVGGAGAEEAGLAGAAVAAATPAVVQASDDLMEKSEAQAQGSGSGSGSTGVVTYTSPISATSASPLLSPHSALQSSLSTKLEPVNESAQSVTFERPTSPLSIHSVGGTSSGPGALGLSQVVVAGGASPGGASPIYPAPPVTPRVGTLPSGSFSRLSRTMSPPSRATSPVTARTVADAKPGPGMTIKSKKVQGVTVAIGVVRNSQQSPSSPPPPASASSPVRSRSGGQTILASAGSAAGLPTVICGSATGPPSEASVSRSASFSHSHADGIGYAVSLYNVAGPCGAAPFTSFPEPPADVHEKSKAANAGAGGKMGGGVLALSSPSSIPGAITRRTRVFLSAAWVGARRWTGFAVNTKPVLDSRVRRAQQMAAMKSMALCSAVTLVILIVITAIP